MRHHPDDPTIQTVTIEELEEQRRKLWPRLSAAQKRAAKEASERATARITEQMQPDDDPPMREPGDDSWEAAQ